MAAEGSLRAGARAWVVWHNVGMDVLQASCGIRMGACAVVWPVITRAADAGARARRRSARAIVVSSSVLPSATPHRIARRVSAHPAAFSSCGCATGGCAAGPAICHASVPLREACVGARAAGACDAGTQPRLAVAAKHAAARTHARKNTRGGTGSAR